MDNTERSAGHVDQRLEMNVARPPSVEYREDWGIVLPHEILEGSLRRRLSLGSFSVWSIIASRSPSGDNINCAIDRNKAVNHLISNIESAKLS